MHHEQSQRSRVSILVPECGKYAAPVVTFLTTGGWSACSPVQGKGSQAEARASFEPTHSSKLSLRLSSWLGDDVGGLGCGDAGPPSRWAFESGMDGPPIWLAQGSADCGPFSCRWRGQAHSNTWQCSLRGHGGLYLGGSVGRVGAWSEVSPRGEWAARTSAPGARPPRRQQLRHGCR